MQKVFVINTISQYYEQNGCHNIFQKLDEYKTKCSAKLRGEAELTEKFNEKTRQGFSFVDAKVFPHELYVDNIWQEERSSTHGVFRFDQQHPGACYQVYFGPIIRLGEQKKKGCKVFGIGCKTKGIGCKEIIKQALVECGIKGIGCNASDASEQYLNFLNDEKNNQTVQDFNKYFGLRQEPHSKLDDYIYDTIEDDKFVGILSELVKKHYDEIVAQFNSETEEFYKNGYGFERLIDTLSEDDLYTQAMLFSNLTNTQVAIAPLQTALPQDLTLSRFDLWYFKKTKGFLRYVWDGIKNWILSWFGRRLKEDEVFGDSSIEDENIKYLEKIYEEDLNSQQEVMNDIKNYQPVFTNIPVTLALPVKQSWWEKIFWGPEYTFKTYLLNGVKK